MASPANSKKKRSPWLIPGIVLAVIVVAGIVFSKKNKDTGTAVTMEAVAKRTIVETVSANGKVYPEEELKISSDVSGTLVDVYVVEGDSVKEGQILARVNPDQLESVVERAAAAADGARAQVQTLSAQLQQANANLQNARNILARQKKLYDDGVISTADYENAQTAVLSAEANVESIRQNIKASEFNVASANATVKEQRVNLSRTAIYAPMSGVVTNISRKKGEQVVGTIQMAGTEIMRIANMKAIEVRVDVSENEVMKVSVGDTADIEVDAYSNRKFKGVVTHISNSANNLDAALVSTDKVIEFTVKVHVLESSYADLTAIGRSPFLPGMSASVEIRTNTLASVLSVPIGAVTTRAKEDDKNKNITDAEVLEVVFIHQADTVEMREVSTGIQDDSYIQVLSGLKEKEMVVTGPYTAISKDLEAGKKVRKEEKEKLYKSSKK